MFSAAAGEEEADEEGRYRIRLLLHILTVEYLFEFYGLKRYKSMNEPITLAQLTTALAPINATLLILTDKIDRMEQSQNISEAKRQNSSKGRSEALTPVPLMSGQFPNGFEFPPTIAHLLVSGNETLPGGTVKNSWNNTKSTALLKAYGENSDGENSDTEDGFTARRRRMKVAKAIGVTTSQINMYMSSLN
eukprot:gene15296-32398_t